MRDEKKQKKTKKTFHSRMTSGSHGIKLFLMTNKIYICTLFHIMKKKMVFCPPDTYKRDFHIEPSACYGSPRNCCLRNRSKPLLVPSVLGGKPRLPWLLILVIDHPRLAIITHSHTVKQEFINNSTFYTTNLSKTVTDTKIMLFLLEL